jgi:hypothetical protein
VFTSPDSCPPNDERTVRLLSDPEVLEPTGDQTAVDWLLGSDEPAVRYLTRRDVLDESAEQDAREILSGPKVTTLLSGQQTDGGFGRNAPHWAGAIDRLVSLVELAVPPREHRCTAAADNALTWILGRQPHRGRVTVIDGLARVCASAEGRVLAASCRIGLASDLRVRRLVEALIDWQWPDGGWNCDRKASGYRSSFHESLGPAWGLHEYARATGDAAAREAADRAAELFLQHRVFYSLSTGKPISKSWLKLHYPPYWHYDILQALLILSRMGMAKDPRTHDALDEVERRRRPDGRWSADWQWWNLDEGHKITEVVDWGRSGQPNEMLTLNALRVLRAAGRLDDGSDAGH